MNNSILHSEIQDFINNNLTSDISKILFKGTHFENITTQELVEQIEAKKRSQFKLSSWFNTDNIYYPNKLNIEQTSSEITANYKAHLIKGNSLIDLTGGFGVDDFYFSKNFNQVTHCEIDSNLSKIVTHNLKQLNIKNITTIESDGILFLQNNNTNFDWIYIDPSRRNDTKQKVFLLEDCLPNVPKHLNEIFNYTQNILIKTSPILDLKSAINELKFVKEIHIISVKNEVKELLFLLEYNFSENITIKTCNILDSLYQQFEFKINTNTDSSYSLPLKFLYEPNSAILKSGGFHEVTAQFDVFKLQQHSHLYTSNDLIDFPGRRFEILHCLPFDKKQLKKLIPENKANVTTRNFPQTVAQIRKKTSLKDGGNHYLFFTTNSNNKHIVISCKKV